MPLTDVQRAALPALRAEFNRALGSLLGTTQSVDERARAPDLTILPKDVEVRVEIAPPSQQPHPLLAATGKLRSPERVPVYFFTLGGKEALDAPKAADRIIFFVHGGGNVVGHPTHTTFLNLYVHLLRAVAAHPDAGRCILIAPSYRLATVPENAFPAALQDLVAAYDYVLAKGYNASNIVIAGDSAGGNHAIVLTHLILQSDRSPPQGVVPIAATSMTVFDRMSEYAKSQASNDTLDLVGTHEWVSKAYLGDSGLTSADPLVSSTFITFKSSWPKTLILIGSADQLIDGSRELKNRLVDLNRPVELVEYDERPHGWWALPQLFSEDIEDAARRIAEFLLH